MPRLYLEHRHENSQDEMYGTLVDWSVFDESLLPKSRNTVSQSQGGVVQGPPRSASIAKHTDTASYQGEWTFTGMRRFSYPNFL